MILFELQVPAKPNIPLQAKHWPTGKCCALKIKDLLHFCNVIEYNASPVVTQFLSRGSMLSAM